MCNCFSEGITRPHIGKEGRKQGKGGKKIARNGDDIIKPIDRERWRRTHGKSIKEPSSR